MEGSRILRRSAGRLSDVRGARFRPETTLRLGGNGDNWHMSWAADDRQFVSMCDGFGWSDQPKAYNSRMLAISGSPADATFCDLPTYPELINEFDQGRAYTRYYGFGTLAIDGCIYQFLSTPNVPFDRPAPRFVGAKLIYSPDNGTTWCNQDGSTPVVWEPWEERTRSNMYFFEEAQDAFSLVTVLQMGRGYAANVDGYVYLYAPNGNVDGAMNQLVMARVPKEGIRFRSLCEYFAGFDGNGKPRWTPDMDARACVHVFPRGWVNTEVHPYAWHPSVAYNEVLDLYMMTNWGMGCTPGGMWFGKPSYLGLWVAASPWGPWEQIFEDLAWTPGGDSAARAYQPQISPKWIAADGRSFWLVWTDFQEAAGSVPDRTVAPFDELRAALARAPSVEEFLRERAASRPFYAFNTQRVDLVSR